MTLLEMMIGSPNLLYIDIGSGALVLQVAVASFLGSVFFLRSFITTWARRVKNVFVRQHTDGPPKESDVES